MTQFEFDQLTILANAWRIRAEHASDPTEVRICRSHADELQGLLRTADTAPGGAPDSEPDRLPNMRHPRPLPKFEDA